MRLLHRRGVTNKASWGERLCARFFVTSNPSGEAPPNSGVTLETKVTPRESPPCGCC